MYTLSLALVQKLGPVTGSATVYAGDVPVPVTVYAGTSLPPGTVNWSVGVNASGPGQVSVVPAVPSSTGADAFVLDASGTLSALSSDGSVAWSAPGVAGLLGYGQGAQFMQFLGTSIVPDFSGGAVLKNSVGYTDSSGNVHDTHTVSRYDPGTQQTTLLYTFSDYQVSSLYPGYFTDAFSQEAVIPGTSGILFVQDNLTVNVIDLTGQQPTANISLPSGAALWLVGKMIVAGDGNAYVPYLDGTGGLYVLRVSPDGSHNISALSSGDTIAPTVITNADKGVAVFSGREDSFNNYHIEITYVSGDSITA